MKAKENNRSGSFDWTIVKEALRRAIPYRDIPSGRSGLAAKIHNVEISVLINDVFGGEILKTRDRGGWHYYNRINGEQIDLDGEEVSGSRDDSAPYMNSLTPAKSSGNFEQNDYNTLFQRFVTALEESFGRGVYQPA